MTSAKTTKGYAISIAEIFGKSRFMVGLGGDTYIFKGEFEKQKMFNTTSHR
jgi:hypothetical protein